MFCFAEVEGPIAMNYRSTISLSGAITIFFPFAAFATILICNVEEKTVDFNEKVDAVGISFSSKSEATDRCKENLTGASDPNLARDEDLEDFCKAKNPDSTSCTLKSASGTIQNDDSGNTTFTSTNPRRKKQGRWIVECSATVSGSCVFECTTCASVCTGSDSSESDVTCIEPSSLESLVTQGSLLE
jgi:hypothetical protein